jgi:hypothetical protein
MDFAGWIETWRRVLTQPGEPVFEQEKMNPNGTLQTALIWMVIAGVVAAIFGLIAGAIGASSMSAALSQAGLPPEMEAQLAPMIGMMTGSSIAAIITVPVFFLIGTFILHLIAKMLGGQGEYSTFAYLSSTFQAPLTIASSILAIIPFLGGCVSLLIMIYNYVLSFYAVKANYGLTSGRAIAVVLIPLALLMVLGICFIFVVAGSIAALSGGN